MLPRALSGHRPRFASLLHVCGSPIDGGTYNLKIIPGLLTSRKAEEELRRTIVAIDEVQDNCENDIGKNDRQRENSIIYSCTSIVPCTLAVSPHTTAASPSCPRRKLVGYLANGPSLTKGASSSSVDQPTTTPSSNPSSFLLPYNALDLVRY